MWCGFHTHKGERYKKRPRRGHILNLGIMSIKNFDDLGNVDQTLGSIKLKIPTFKGQTDMKAYLD